MLRITACIFIIFTLSALGFLKASSYRQRRAELESIQQLMRLLEIEISYRRDALAKTFQRTGAQKACWFSDVLRYCGDMMEDETPLSEAWSRALAANADACPLLPEDVTIISDVSLGLGRSDAEGQQRIFTPAAERLAEAIRSARAAEQKQGRMYRGLGIGAGVVLAILLV